MNTIDRMRGMIDPGAMAAMKRPRRGKFIVFDGIDGSGKGTAVGLTQKLLNRLGITVFTTKQPGGSQYGMEVRKILFETVGTAMIEPDALELLFLSNHVHNAALIERALADGRWVIADRWSPSAIAYMGERDASQQMRDLYMTRLEDVRWDLFFLLTGDPAKLLERAQRRTTETHQTAKKWNNVEAMIKIDAEFKRLFSADPRTIMLQTDVVDETALLKLIADHLYLQFKMSEFDVDISVIQEVVNGRVN